MKLLYGICDAGDLWALTMDKYHRLSLGMTPLRSEPALYLKLEGDKVIGLSGLYVDDLLRAGNQSFGAQSRKKHEVFDMGEEEEELQCTSTGFELHRDGHGNIRQHQTPYLRQLECLSRDATLSEFRSMRMKLAWLSHTRADCLFEISQLAQITEKIFNNEKSGCIRRLNKAARFALKHSLIISISKLDIRSLKVVGYYDSSFANNIDLSTKLGYIMFLVDAGDRSVPMAFRSYKDRRFVSSAMTDEVIAFSDMFDTAITLAEEIRSIKKRHITLQLLTDSKSLFDVISKGSRTSENRLMLDWPPTRGIPRQNDKQHWLREEQRKPRRRFDQANAPGTLQRFLPTDHIDTKAEHWIVRT